MFGGVVGHAPKLVVFVVMLVVMLQRVGAAVVVKASPLSLVACIGTQKYVGWWWWSPYADF